MSYTPNPTWQDFESGGTKIQAAKLNHQEAGILEASQRLDVVETNGVPDSTVRTELFGNQTRTKRVLLVAKLTSPWTIGTLTDTWAQQGWSATSPNGTDTDSAFHAGSATSGDYCYWTAPLSRRYDIEFHIQTTSGAADTILVGAVELNSAVISASICRDSNEVAASSELAVTARRMSYPITAGSKVYWSAWCKGAGLTLGTSFGNADTVIVIRDAGPI